jgi:hypothetical protein
MSDGVKQSMREWGCGQEGCWPNRINSSIEISIQIQGYACSIACIALKTKKSRFAGTSGTGTTVRSLTHSLSHSKEYLNLIKFTVYWSDILFDSVYGHSSQLLPLYLCNCAHGSNYVWDEQSSRRLTRIPLSITVYDHSPCSQNLWLESIDKWHI